MKIVFLGSGAFGLPTLGALCAPESGHSIVGVVTQPDRPAGRGGRRTPTPIGAWAAERLPDVPLLKPENVNDRDVIASIRSLGGEATDPGVAWVVIAYGQKLSRALVEGVFAVNLHGSLLPRWRGAAPINHAILAGDAFTGNSVITIAERMDAGLVLGASEPALPIDPLATAGDLHDRLAADGARVVLRVLEEQAQGAVRGVPQDESRVTPARKLSRADAWVDFRQPAEACRRRIHGLTPWPGVSVEIDDGTGRGPRSVKVLRVQAEPGDGQGDPGRVVDGAAGLAACGGGSALRLLEVQPAGKRAMSWSDYVRGNPLGADARVRSQVPPPDRTQGEGRC